MSILKLARVPAVTIESSASVISGIRAMKDERVGALFVVEDGRLVGCLSERDIASRVVLGQRDPAATHIREVMTSPALTLPEHATVTDAIRLMVARRVRHLPIVVDGTVKGMVSLRHMLRERERDLTEELDSMAARICADGIGG